MWFLFFFFSPLKISWNKIYYAKISGQEIATRCEQETSNLSLLMKIQSVISILRKKRQNMPKTQIFRKVWLKISSTFNERTWTNRWMRSKINEWDLKSLTDFKTLFPLKKVKKNLFKCLSKFRKQTNCIYDILAPLRHIEKE